MRTVRTDRQSGIKSNLPVEELLPIRGIRVLSQGINSRPGASEGQSTGSSEIPMVSAERTENPPSEAPTSENNLETENNLFLFLNQVYSLCIYRGTHPGMTNIWRQRITWKSWLALSFHHVNFRD